MKKISIIVILALVAVSMQYCKKSSSTDSTTTAVLFQAYVNGSLWTPTSTTAVLTYNVAAGTKTFSFVADSSSTDQIVLNIQQASSTDNSDFALATYSVDTVSTYKNKMAYNKLVNHVYTPVGILLTGSVVISSVDAVNNLVTGSFSFYESRKNYDSNGNVVSVTSTAITSGEFNNLPYTYKKQ